jgi:hypothetical protein
MRDPVPARGSPSLPRGPHGLVRGRTFVTPDRSFLDGSAAGVAVTGVGPAPAERRTLSLRRGWNAFRALDFARLGRSMAAKVLVDLRNVYRPEEVERHGFAYTSVGRGEG